MASLSAPARRDPAGVEETLGWEAEHRPRAGVAAIFAGLAILAGAIIQGLSTRNVPGAPLISALEGALQGDPNRPSLRVASFQYIDDRVIALSLGALLPGLGFLALIPVLGYLYRAAAARAPKVPRAALVLGLVGPGLLGVGTIAYQARRALAIHDFLGSGDQSVAAANNINSSTLSAATQLLQIAGTLATGFALILIALSAMRAGLLTRFMGILGMISGAALVLLPANPVINFWLVALGFLILGRWPGGVPPAWGSGRAEPWPSQQELRERREQARAQPAVDESEPTADPDADRPVLQKRKRKRR